MSNFSGEGPLSENVPIIIGGPTASGKSQLAIDLATALNGVVINADASQVYKSIPIISAAPSLEDKEKVVHRLYEYLDDEDTNNVVSWLSSVEVEIRRAWLLGKTPIIVGGSGLYIDNLINGTTPIPEVNPEIREEAFEILAKENVDGLYKRLLSIDPAGSLLVNSSDSTRVRRAYEIFKTTGVSIAQWFNEPLVKKIPETDFFVIKLLPDKTILDNRCDLRFDIMISHGAIQEVKNLLLHKVSPMLPVMKAKGVPELCAYLTHTISLEEAIQTAKIHTHQYAKRQLTWFRHKLKANIVLPKCYDGNNEILNDVKKQYKMLQNLNK